MTAIELIGFLAAICAGLAALGLTVRLRLPQILQLPAALRALREEDPSAPGSTHPATAVAMSTAMSYGAAAAVGAATAVSLGGPGAIAWVWVFSFFLAPLRMGEAVLARTAPAGQAGTTTGSLAGRLLSDPAPVMRVLGWAVLVLVPVAGFAFFGGTHGGAVLDAAEQLLPGSAMVLGVAVAGVGAALALLPVKRFGSLLGWMAAVSLIALFGAALVTLFSDLGRGIGGIGRALNDVFYGMQSAGAFSGALAGEIAIAAMLHLLPPLAAGVGVDGAWHAEAQAKTTRAQASAALLGPLVYGLLTTALGLALIATNAFARPVESARPISEIRFFDAAFETVSQRTEESRRFNGIIRTIVGQDGVEDGTTGVVGIHAGHDRGMIRSPRFEENGEPADVMLRVEDSRVIEVQRPGLMGALEVAGPEAMRTVMVEGEMLPRGGQLLAEAVTQGGGAVTSRVALAALLLLAALGIAGWGWGVRKTLASRIPDSVARFAALLPALGVGVAVMGGLEDFASVGLVTAAILTITTSLALIGKSGEIAALLTPRKGASTEPAPAPEASPDEGPRKKRKKRR